MLTSIQKILQRVPRRRVLPSPNALLLHGRQQQQELPPPSVFHTTRFLHSSCEDEEDSQQPKNSASHFHNRSSNSTLWNNSTTTTRMGLMTMARPNMTSPLLSAAAGRQVMWFSTTKADSETNSYKDRAAHYGNQAKDGAKSFGGMMKTYGPVFIGTYLSVYAMTLGSLYVGVESGVLDPVTILGYITGNHEEARSSAEVVAEMLEHYTITEPFAEMVREKPPVANFAIAWVTTKFTEPMRLGLTAVVVPRVARHFGVGPKANIPPKNEEATQEEETKGEDGAVPDIDASSKAQKKA